MNPLLEQFLSEAREFLQSIAEKLIELEQQPDSPAMMAELFRLVHTLKGNSGLFEFPEMTRVLHAGEDLMDAVRQGTVAYSQDLADQLLDAMDFVSLLCDEIEKDGGSIQSDRIVDSYRLAESLRRFMTTQNTSVVASTETDVDVTGEKIATIALPVEQVPEAIRIGLFKRLLGGDELFWVHYVPDMGCFFQGDDPLHSVRQLEGVIWGQISARDAWPTDLAELDAYHCNLNFDLISSATRAEITEHFRYVPDQVQIIALNSLALVVPVGLPNGGPVYEDFVAEALSFLEQGDLEGLKQVADTMLQLSNPDLWLSSALRWLTVLIETVPDQITVITRLIESLRSLSAPDWENLQIEQSQAAPPVQVNIAAAESESQKAESVKSVSGLVVIPEVQESVPNPIVDDMVRSILATQLQILQLDDGVSWEFGRVKAVISVLQNCVRTIGDLGWVNELDTVVQQTLDTQSSEPLIGWLSIVTAVNNPDTLAEAEATAPVQSEVVVAPVIPEVETTSEVQTSDAVKELGGIEETGRFARRPEEGVAAAKSLKVDQVKIDRLMNLIGEMVVSKNALPYLAQRAEDQYQVRELSREIKSQYAVINRIVEEMQDAIMQVRMMPVSFIFQRFPRLVRDIARKLGKEVQLHLEGEETEADKNIVEALADPLIHIVRNSLDHGLELPAQRQAAGKPAAGNLHIKASHEGDQVIIEIVDDGNGINPDAVKQKAYEKGLIDEQMLEKMTDREAINLIFMPGFSTAAVVSDLSGRGVGMDVVRTAVEKVNGNIQLDSEMGKGTRIRIALPLSMAVTKVMLIESDGQSFGVPMDHVVETVRIPDQAITYIKQSRTTMLRGRIVVLKTLNEMLCVDALPIVNENNEYAVLIVRVGQEIVGLIIDDFHETVDVIQKPLTGVLGGLGGYSGSALMGDGSVLMILNVRELL